MNPRTIARVLKNLKVGEPVEIIWRDACTSSTRWLDKKEANSVTLAMILTRGAFVGVEDGAVKIALDCGLLDDGSIGDFHTIGVVDVGAIAEVYALRRKGRTKK